MLMRVKYLEKEERGSMVVVRSLYFGLSMVHRMHAEIMYMKNTSSRSCTVIKPSFLKCPHHQTPTRDSSRKRVLLSLTALHRWQNSTGSTPTH